MFLNQQNPLNISFSHLVLGKICSLSRQAKNNESLRLWNPVDLDECTEICFVTQQHVERSQSLERCRCRMLDLILLAGTEGLLEIREPYVVYYKKILQIFLLFCAVLLFFTEANVLVRLSKLMK